MTHRHAYLIIAHAHPFALEHLLKLIDDERNDIYLHIDKKSSTLDIDYFSKLVKKSRLVAIKPQDIRWGHVSQIKLELDLFKTARSTASYGYYHLISGADMPLKTQDEIHQFFTAWEGAEFIGYSKTALDITKVEYYHLFSRYMRVGEDKLWQRMARKIRLLFNRLQEKLSWKYRTSPDSYIHGPNWVSISQNLVDDLIQLEDMFLHFYKRSSCADEIYKHSFVYNSEYYNKLYDMNDELKGCMRYMDWQRGRPYTFRKEDFNLLMEQEYLFARKLEDETDTEIIAMIYAELRDRERRTKQK